MTQDLYAVVALCVLSCSLGAAGTVVFRDRWWLREFKQEKANWFEQERQVYQSGVRYGTEQGEKAGYARALRDQQERQRHAAL